MKERNKARKLALKKAKEKRLHRQQLKNDIAQYMVDFFMDNVENHTAELEKCFINGTVGFKYLKNAKLVKEFEALYRRIMSKAKPQVILCQWKGYPSRRVVLEGKDYDDRLAAYIFEGDALMNRLIEVSFDLDFEE